MTHASRLLLSTLLLALGPATPALADWTLDSESARVHFVSVKAGKIAEVHRFERVRGGLDGDGNVRIEITLASVDTGIEIRNERMQSMLFEVSEFPMAIITAQLAPAAFANLSAGESRVVETAATLALHGRTQALDLAVRVTGARDGGLLVSSVAPVIVNAADFALARGVERLREVAGLPSISPAVPVTFSLAFD
jgi:polyisoprenoid-binding protein YceI